MSGIFGIINFGITDSPKEALLDAMAISMQDLTRGEETEKAIEKNASIGIVCERTKNHWICDEELIVAASGELYGPEAISIAEGVAEAYRLYGEGCVTHFDGKFNFCLWDKKRGKLFIATDRFGSSIINYYHDDKRFIFASKIRAITATSLFRPSIDKNAVYNYCVFTFIPTPQTIYSQIKKLPPGHIIIVTGSKIDIHKYWDITYDDEAEAAGNSEAYYCLRIREELEAAVRRRFDPSRNIERVGAFLSGGLDSSAISGLMRSIAGKEIDTFSIGFDEPKYSEIEYVNIAAKHFGLKSYQYIIKPHELPDAINALAEEYDEPFGNSSAIAAYHCMKMAKANGIKILLAGDGGDENFGGYERYVSDKAYSIYQGLPCWLRRHIMEPLIFRGPFKNAAFFKKAGNYINHSNLPRPERFYFYELYPMRARSDIFTEDFINDIKPDGPLEVINAFYNAPKTRFALNRLTYLDSKIVLIENDLRNKIDKVSQVTGVDVRFPMLDLKLWELGARIPPSLKLRGYRKKYIYKKAFKDFLPKEIITKKKHGFGLPFAVWLRQEPSVRRYVEDILLDPSVEKRGYCKVEFFQKILKMHDAESSSYYGDLLWPFLMLEVWHRKWIDK